MPKTKLDKQYLWKGKFYGPGEVEFPSEAITSFELASQLSGGSFPQKRGAKEKEEQSEPEPPAEGSASPTTKTPKVKP